MADLQPDFASVLQSAIGTLQNSIRFSVQVQQQRQQLEQQFALQREQLDLQRESLELRQQVAAAKTAQASVAEKKFQLRDALEAYTSQQPMPNERFRNIGVLSARRMLAEDEKQLTNLLDSDLGQIHQLATANPNNTSFMRSPAIDDLTRKITEGRAALQIREQQATDYYGSLSEQQRVELRLQLPEAAPTAPAPSAPAASAGPTPAQQKAAAAAPQPAPAQTAESQLAERARALAPKLADQATRRQFVQDAAKLLNTHRGPQGAAAVNRAFAAISTATGDQNLASEVFAEMLKARTGAR